MGLFNNLPLEIIKVKIPAQLHQAHVHPQGSHLLLYQTSRRPHRPGHQGLPCPSCWQWAQEPCRCPAQPRWDPPPQSGSVSTPEHIPLFPVTPRTPSEPRGAPVRGEPRRGEGGQAFPHAHCSVCWGLKTDLPSRRAQLNPKWKTDPGQPASGADSEQIGGSKPRSCPRAPAWRLVVKFALGSVSPLALLGGGQIRPSPEDTPHGAGTVPPASGPLPPARTPSLMPAACPPLGIQRACLTAAPARRCWSESALPPPYGEGGRCLPGLCRGLSCRGWTWACHVRTLPCGCASCGERSRVEPDHERSVLRGTEPEGADGLSGRGGDKGGRGRTAGAHATPRRPLATQLRRHSRPLRLGRPCLWSLGRPELCTLASPSGADWDRALCVPLVSWRAWHVPGPAARLGAGAVTSRSLGSGVTG